MLIKQAVLRTWRTHEDGEGEMVICQLMDGQGGLHQNPYERKYQRSQPQLDQQSSQSQGHTIL